MRHRLATSFHCLCSSLMARMTAAAFAVAIIGYGLSAMAQDQPFPQPGGGGGGGGVSSVGLSDGSTTPIFSITGSPVTSSGTLTETLKTQSANTIFAGPTTGSATQPGFRAIVPADLPLATTGAFGAVKPDGSTITISGGVISSVGGGETPANPTATAGPTAVNGVATTYMRSDAAPPVQKGTNAQFGIVEGDGTTINCVAGVCTAIGGAATSIGVGTTTVSAGTANYLLSVNSGGTVLANVPPNLSSIGMTATNHTTSGTLANVGGQDDFNGSGLTATLATLGSGGSQFLTNQAGGNLTIALAGQTVNGIPAATKTLLHNYGFCGYVWITGATLDAYCFPGFDTITAGALPKFSDATGATTASLATESSTGLSIAEGAYTPPVALSISGGSVAVNAASSTAFTLAATASFALSNPTNLNAGQEIDIWITQDSTGSRVMSLGSEYQAAGGSSTLVLSTAANTKDELICRADTTTSLTCGLLKAISH